MVLKHQAEGLVWQEDSTKMGRPGVSQQGAIAVTLPLGVYLIRGSQTDTIQFLPHGDTQWKQESYPHVFAKTPCAVTISQTAFMLIGHKTWSSSTIKIHEFDASGPDGPTAQSGWKPGNTWPSLKKFRHYGHSCQLYYSKVVVAGGVSCGKCVEIIDLATKKVTHGPDLVQARSFFGLTTFERDGNPQLVAYGGRGESGSLDTVEVLHEETNVWQTIPEKLSREQHVFQGKYAALTKHVEENICAGIIGNGICHYLFRISTNGWNSYK